ncbi:MAG: zinc ribbon domain-containing protein [Opitutaceae bacterium]|nr:zinc ribbon domain-containing protein [Opitutaceae bacterium]
MPTYEYVCQKCGHAFEAFQSMRDEPLKKCPECRKPALKRLVGSGAGLIFKGTGFYITDYKNKGGGNKEGGEGKGSEGKSGEGKSGEGTGGEGKGGEGKPAESKPAEKKSSSESKPASDSKSGGGSKPSPRSA